MPSEDTARSTGSRYMTEYYDRARLLEEVWSAPLRDVAPQYGLSDVGLKKLCVRLQIPTPGRGYWAKLKAGKRIPSRPVLRDFTGLVERFKVVEGNIPR